MNEHIDLISRFYTPINEHRFGDYDGLFAPDATLEGPGGVTGPDAMRAFDQVWTTASSDFTITPLVQLSVAGKVSSEDLVEATHDGLLELPSGATCRRRAGPSVAATLALPRSPTCGSSPSTSATTG